MPFDDRAFMLDKSQWPSQQSCCVICRAKDGKEPRFGVLLDVLSPKTVLLAEGFIFDPNFAYETIPVERDVDEMIEEGWYVD